MKNMKKNEQKFFAREKFGKLDFYDKGELILFLQRMKGAELTVTIEKETNRRTKKQNNALHLYFQLLADALNDAGWDMRKLLKTDIDIPWTDEAVKDFIWKSIQSTMFKKGHTRDLNTDEVSKVYDVVDRFVGEKTGVHVPFPSIEDVIYS